MRHIMIYPPCNFEVNPILELFPFFHQIFKILILFVLYFKNYKRQMVSWNCKHVQHVKIYIPCNFEVNLISHLGVIALFSSIFSSPDPKGHVSYSHHLASVVRRKLFQKSSPLKVLDQWKPNLVWIITRVSSFKIVSGDAVHQPTWPLLLKIEHMVKLQVFGNNSKTVSNIKNLTWGKNDQHIKIYLPCNFEVNLITHLGVIALFSSNL